MTVLERSALSAPEDGRRRRRIRIASAVAVACAALVVVLALALAVGVGPTDAATGALAWAVPVARLAVRIAALGTVGTLLFAAVLRPSAPYLPRASRHALRAAAVWATTWAAATAIYALLTLTQLAGPSVTVAALRTFFIDLAAGRAALVVLAVSAVVAVAARRCTTSRGAAALLAIAVAGLVVPVVLTGHSATAADHVLAVTNLSLHVAAASLWVGGLLALLVHGRGRDDLAPAAARFSVVALACFLATGASGLLAAWLVLDDGPDGPAAALGTGYGVLLIGKTAALVVLGLLGWHHRRRTLPRLRAGEPGGFRRFASVEAAVMLATVALAVGLSSSPPPAAASDSAARQVSSEKPAADPMAGHDHGELSVTVLIDESRFHVSAPVEAGTRVTVHNSTETEVTITASDGSFDVVVPGGSLITFEAPEEPGSYPFVSRHSPSFADVLVVD